MAELPPIDGVFLKSLRKERGWTQTQMADFLGCSQARVSSFEQGAEIAKPYQKLVYTLLLTPPGGRMLAASPA